MKSLTISQAAERLGVSRQRAHVLKQRNVLIEVPDTDPIEVTGESVKAYQKFRDQRSAPPKRGWLTVETAASEADVHTSTIRAWIQSGRLKASDEGSGLIIRRADLKSMERPAQGRPVGS